MRASFFAVFAHQRCYTFCLPLSLHSFAGPYCALCAANQSDGGSLHYYDKGDSTCRACADRDHKMTIIMCLALGGFLLTMWGVSLLPQTRTVFGYQRRVVKENVKAVAQIFRPVVSFFQVRAAAVVRAAAGCQIQDHQLGAHWRWWSYIWLDKAALLFEHVDTS